MFRASEYSQIEALERACWEKGKRGKERKIKGGREQSRIKKGREKRRKGVSNCLPRAGNTELKLAVDTA